MSPTLKSECPSCRRPKAKIPCGICKNIFCKECIQFLDADSFSFRKTVPDELKHLSYCIPCYEVTVAPPMASYKATMNLARNVYLFDKKSTQVPLIKRARYQITVKDCVDKQETHLRLAFQAAEESYNAVVNVEVGAKTVRTDGYQRSSWHAVGFPANVRTERLKEFSWK